MVNINYGKLIDGRIQYAPVPMNIDGADTWTNDESVFASQGFLPVVNTEEPVRDGYFYTSSWNEMKGRIVKVWNEHIIPEPPTDEDVSNIDETTENEIVDAEEPVVSEEQSPIDDGSDSVEQV